MNQNKSPETKGKNSDSQTQGGITIAEMESLFAMVNDIKANDSDAESREPVPAKVEETVSVKSVRMPSNIDLETIVGELPKRYLFERLLSSSQFRRQMIYFAVQALKN